MKRLIVSALLIILLLPVIQPTKAATGDGSWLKTATMYSIFVRSYRDTDGDGVGDLKGIIEQLDYIQSLGVDTLFLLPVFKAASYHGYDTTDYYTVSPDYGTNDDLIQLAQEVHKRGMHLILDYVLNHTSNQHPYFIDALGNPSSQYSDYYEWTDDAHTKYKGFANLGFMPTLNYDSPKVVQMALDIATYWMDPNKDGDFSDGVDGWRVDVAIEIPHRYFREMRKTMNALNPNAIMLFELFTGDASKMKPFLKGDEANAAFDFPSAVQLDGNFETNGDGLINGQGDVRALRTVMLAVQNIFCAECVAVRFINNHDTNRIASDVNGDPARLKMAAVWLLTAPGASVIYYGEEIGMQGTKGTGPLYDEYRREPFDWYASMTGSEMTSWFKDAKMNNAANDGISVEEEDGKADSLLTLYRQLGELRHTPVFTAGSADTPKLGEALYLSRRWDADTLVLTVINFNTTDQTFTLDPAMMLPKDTSFDLSKAEELFSQGLSGDATLTLAPAGYAVYRVGK
ncbi:MAG: alpha-amylase family glycosyl hydrolase [Anaerolineae bacterium]